MKIHLVSCIAGWLCMRIFFGALISFLIKLNISYMRNNNNNDFTTCRQLSFDAVIVVFFLSKMEMKRLLPKLR